LARERTPQRLRVLLIAAAGLTVAVLLAWALASFAHVNESAAVSRILSIPSTVLSPSKDPSFADRAAQTSAAWQTFLEHPLLGAGPGHVLHWIGAYGQKRQDFVVDSGVSFPEKFGLLGIVVLLIEGVAVVAFLRRLFRSPAGPGSVAIQSLTGYLVLAVAMFILYVPLEDKGLSFGLLFLVALSARSALGWDLTSRPDHSSPSGVAKAVGDGQAGTAILG
jgi:O-antigen ligase